MVKRLLPLLLIYFMVLVLYYPVFSVYFSQDDFFHFKVSQTDGTLGGFLKLFGFYPFEERGIAFYRPLTREVVYNTFYSLFGLNVLPFRILSFAIHFINISLVYFLIRRLFRKRDLAFFVAFFFGITAANVATLYYFTGGIQALGATMFMLLAIVSFLNYLEKRSFHWKGLSFIAYLLALGSHELAVATPVLLGGLFWSRGQGSFKDRLLQGARELWIFILVLPLFLYSDIKKIGFSQQEKQYQAVFSLKRTLNSLSWYAVWALGVPEMLIDFVRPGLKLNPSLMRHWGEYFRLIFASFLASVAILIGCLAYLLVRARKVFRDKKFWFFLLWFPTSLLPVIFLPLHKSTYYLVPALPAFWGAVGFVVFSGTSSIKKKHPRLGGMLLGGITLFLVALSVTSARLGDSTYWAASRGRLAERLLSEVQSMYPELPKGAVVYFKNDPNYPFVANEWGSTSKQASFVLNGEDALQLFYNDPTLKVFYEDLGGIPYGLSGDQVFSLVAQIQ